MINKTKSVSLAALTLAIGLFASATPTAVAAPTWPPQPPPVKEDGDPLVLPPGNVCDFGVTITGTGSKVRVKEFDNGVVIESGKGTLLTVSNNEADASVTFESQGSVKRQVSNGDGTFTVSATGHNLIGLFPTDEFESGEPAGPSLKLYTGRVTYIDDGNANFTVLSISGTQRDICAELAG